MPKATTNIQDTERYELKTCEGGFVELRRLSYGEFLKRRQMSTNLALKSGAGKDFEGVMELANEKVTEFEFANCIVDHNLEDENGEALDFRKVHHLKMLDPRIGEEISTYINKMNQFDEDLGN